MLNDDVLDIWIKQVLFIAIRIRLLLFATIICKAYMINDMVLSIVGTSTVYIGYHSAKDACLSFPRAS